jgi:hypothetical protein
MSKKEMQLAINVASVADGTVAGALTYCKDLGVAKVVVPFGSVPGFMRRATPIRPTSRPSRIRFKRPASI